MPPTHTVRQPHTPARVARARLAGIQIGRSEMGECSEALYTDSERETMSTQRAHALQQLALAVEAVAVRERERVRNDGDLRRELKVTKGQDRPAKPLA